MMKILTISDTKQCNVVTALDNIDLPSNLATEEPAVINTDKYKQLMKVSTSESLFNNRSSAINSV